MKKATTFLMAVAIMGGSAVLPDQAFAGPNCTCRHSGGDVQEGDTACIKTPKGMGLARCERVLNNTSWKMLDSPCPFAEAKELGPPLALPQDHTDPGSNQSKRILTAFDLALKG